MLINFKKKKRYIFQFLLEKVSFYHTGSAFTQHFYICWVSFVVKANITLYLRFIYLYILAECEVETDSKLEESSTDALPSRGVLMVNKSRQSSVFMEDNSASSIKTQDSAKQIKKPEISSVQSGKQINTFIYGICLILKDVGALTWNFVLCLCMEKCAGNDIKIVD